MTRETFEYLCDLVRVDLQKQHTRFRSLVSVEERVGLALGTGNSYRSCGLHLALENRQRRVFVASSSKPFLL